MDLSVVIVNYQTFELTKNTIDSILKYDYSFEYEIFVVDNASSDDSLARLEDYFKDKVRFIASRENNGFAAGNNQALRQATGKYQLLLNSDTIVWQDTLQDIYDYMERHDRGHFQTSRTHFSGFSTFRQKARTTTITSQAFQMMRYMRLTASPARSCS